MYTYIYSGFDIFLNDASLIGMYGNEKFVFFFWLNDISFQIRWKILKNSFSRVTQRTRGKFFLYEFLKFVYFYSLIIRRNWLKFKNFNLCDSL